MLSPVTLIASASFVLSAVAVAVQNYGSLDIFVQNTGIYPWTLIENKLPEKWDSVCAINLKGTFLAARAALPVMKKIGLVV